MQLPIARLDPEAPPVQLKELMRLDRSHAVDGVGEIVILSRLPVIGYLNPISGHLDASLLDRAADPFGQLRFEGLVQARLQLAHPLARGLERGIQVLALGLPEGAPANSIQALSIEIRLTEA
jgi:hypothetical protein